MAFGYTPEQQKSYQPYQLGPQGMQPLKPRSGAGNFFLGEQEQFQRSPTAPAHHLSFLDQILSQAGQGLQDPTKGFDPIAQSVTSQFQQQTVPALLEQLTGSTGGGSSSPAFAQALGSAGAGLGERLAAMKAEYGLRNRQGLLDQANMGLRPQFETIHKKRGSGFFENAASAFGEGGKAFLGAAGKAYGGQFGNYAGNKSFGAQGQPAGQQQIMDLIGQILSAVGK